MAVGEPLAYLACCISRPVVFTGEKDGWLSRSRSHLPMKDLISSSALT